MSKGLRLWEIPPSWELITPPPPHPNSNPNSRPGNNGERQRSKSQAWKFNFPHRLSSLIPRVGGTISLPGSVSAPWQGQKKVCSVESTSSPPAICHLDSPPLLYKVLGLRINPAGWKKLAQTRDHALFCLLSLLRFVFRTFPLLYWVVHYWYYQKDLTQKWGRERKREIKISKNFFKETHFARASKIRGNNFILCYILYMYLKEKPLWYNVEYRKNNELRSRVN